MNLVVDEGNTLIKIALFDEGKLLFHQSFEKGNIENNFLESVDFQNVKSCIVASVTADFKQRFSFLRKHLTDVLFLDQRTPMPFVNKYATPETIGIDRLALMAAAVFNYPERNVLVIDAGTCITFDIMTKERAYLGGAIAPGIAMRLKAMHQFTAKLPLIAEQEFDIHKFIGNSTESCILSGVYHNVVCEIDGVIERYKSKFENLTIILTGGSHLFLVRNIKNCIFANSFFLLEGLNAILEFRRKEIDT